MKRGIRCVSILLLGVFLMVVGCSKEETVVEGFERGEEVKRVSGVKGVIGYVAQVDKFAIFTGVDGAYDSQGVGLVSVIPEEFQVEGLEVVFDGVYYSCDGISPSIPGQVYYYLDVSAIKLLTN
ncbi:hypothetical protein [Sunxiuqinia elliptica]|uniref:Uncharacterized protein n=1 Tax=Sunxiuqinia elliptica TaxID=655355 RepID=A0A4R6HBW8_9BACT|nr:hypothetical protein [Sunxiuqinia elliptica]TDO05185.1 hypothetical protein DET52_101541 [Sunxiuqinia elliptica]TDO64734.1 hypothetical protein DET65_1100 [Sunxiuqinia elliptica]